MKQARPILGLVGGGILVLSSAAHTLLGWPAMSGQLSAAGAPPALILGMKVGWQFGGAAMLAFGILVLAGFYARLRGKDASLLPAKVIAAVYLMFGAWALVVTGFDPFFLIFIVPAVLIGAALL